MQVPSVSTDLDFQTVFEIVCAIEGFFVWKGSQIVRKITSARITEDCFFDERYFDGLCERLKREREQRGRLALRLWWMIVWHFIKRTATKAIACLKSVFGSLFVWTHNAIRWTIQRTAPVSVLALAFSYLLQIGFDDGVFRGGVWVFWFLVVKTGCCLLCIGMEWGYRVHIGVTAKSKTVNENISSKEASPPPAGSASPPSSAPA